MVDPGGTITGRIYFGANRIGKTRAMLGEVIAEAWPYLSWWQKLRVRWMLWRHGL